MLWLQFCKLLQLSLAIQLNWLDIENAVDVAMMWYPSYYHIIHHQL